jgi:hypothetical protein
MGGDVTYAVPTGTTARAGGYIVIARVPADVAAVYGITNALGPISGSLPNGSGQVSLYNSLGALLLDVEYTDHHPWPAGPDGVGPSLVLARPSYGEGVYKAWSASAAKGGTPGAGESFARSTYAAIVINEVLSHTDLPDMDYIELFNTGDVAVDVSGMILRVDTNAYTIPAATTLPARGALAFTETQMGFGIRMEGGRVSLQDPSGTHVIDMVLLQATMNGAPVGRDPDGGASLQELRSPTPGSNNAPARIRDIVINEVMFHPISNSDADEYVELYNRGTSTVDISGWRLSDGITYTFPTNTFVAPGGFVVVAANATNLIARYPQLSGANTVGNYAGKLSDNSDRLALEMPEDPLFPTLNFVLVDEVVYLDGWGTWSDGDGSSLELIDPDADNSLAGNWVASDETAKGTWTNLVVTGILDHGLETALDLHVMLLKAGEAMVDDFSVMRTTVNRVTNSTFDASADGWYARGNHMHSSRDATNGVGGTGGYRIIASGGGDPGPNRIDTSLWTGNTLTAGDTVTMQVSARWMAGHPDLLVRLQGGWLELSERLPVPRNLGTPAQTNSRAVANAGPAISKLEHDPALPAAGEDVVIRASVSDPDGIAAVFLDYRFDPSPATNSVAMTNLGGGVYGATLAGPAADTLVAYRVRAVDADAAPATNVYPGTSSGEALVRVGSSNIGGNLGTYHLWLTKAHIDAWTNAPKLSNEFWPATLVAGVRIIHNAGAHYRGSAFIRPTFDTPTGAPCAYRVDVPKADRFLGVDELNLDTLEPWRDNTRQRERTIFWMGSRIGIPGSYQRYIGLYLNGARRSDVYADVFHVEGEYVESWYPDDPDGEIYKVDDWIEFTNDLYEFDYDTGKEDATLESFKTTGGAYKKARYRWTWEKKSNGWLDDNFTNLFALVDAVNETNASARAERVAALANIDEWMKVIALRHAVCDWDGYGYARGKNAYLYKPTAGPFQLLLWDLDFGLGTPDAHPVDISILHEIADPALSNRVFGLPVYLRAYLQSMKAIVDGPMLFASVDPVVDDLYAALADNGIDAYPPDDLKSWIGLRRNYIVTQLDAWDAAFAITSNGGGNFSTNVNYITLAGTAPLDVRGLTVNGIAYAPTWTSASNWTVRVVLTAGLNALNVVGVDGSGNAVSGASDTIGVTYTGSDASPAGHVAISEIHYNPAGAGSEFIELHNRSGTHAFDLYGMSVDGVGLTFTGATVVLPGGFVVLVSDRMSFASAYGGIPVAATYAGTLDNGGERLRLLQPNGTNAPALLDDVLYDDGLPWPALADGGGASLQLIDGDEDNNRVGNWAVDATGLATPGATNSVAADLPSFPLIWLNELMASNTAGVVDNATNRDPWVELFSQHTDDRALTNFYLTDSYTNLARWRFPDGAFAPSNGFRLTWLDGQTNQLSGTNYHASFRPATTTGSVALVLSNGTNFIVVDYMNHPAIATNVSYGDYPDGVWTNRALFQVPTPGASNSAASASSVNLRINEFMADNVSWLDPYNKANDWIEIYNVGTNAVDLTDFGLTDNLSQPFKWRFPTGLVIAGQAFLVVWAENGAPASQTQAVYANTFALGKGGEAIGLYRPDGATLDAFTFGAQTTDVTQGRWPDGAASLAWLGYPTPGAANVSRSNAFPVLAPIGDKSLDELGLLTFTVSATDTDTPPQVLTYSLDSGAPTNATIGAMSGLFAWTPGEEQGPSVTAMVIRVTDNGYLSRSVAETITVTIAEVNEAPLLPSPGTVHVNPGSRFTYNMAAMDGDIPANTLTYGLAAGQGDLAADGWFSWTPGTGDALTTNVVMVTVFDDGVPVLAHTSQVDVVVYDVDRVFEAETVPSLSGTGIVVRWSAETGATYRVYRADELFTPSWIELQGDVVATDSVAEKTDATTNALDQRYYRVIRLLP